MIVEAVDGLFYRNPIFSTPKWLLQVTDDGCFIKRSGRVMWTTTRRPLARGGVKCRFVSTRNDGKAILDERLVKVSVFEVDLKKPIPVPQSHEGCLTLRPDKAELDGEEVLSWTKT